MKNNIGEALLILGGIYALIFISIPWWGKIGIIIMIGLAIYTWEQIIHPKELIENLRLNNLKTRLEIELMKAQTQWYVAQGAMIMRGLR